MKVATGVLITTAAVGAVVLWNRNKVLSFLPGYQAATTRPKVTFTIGGEPLPTRRSAKKASNGR